MKKKTNKKLILNKERISEFSVQNMGKIKGGESQINDYCHAYTYYSTCLDCLILDLTVGDYCTPSPSATTDALLCR